MIWYNQAKSQVCAESPEWQVDDCFRIAATSAKTLLKQMLNTRSRSSPSIVANELSLYAWSADTDQLNKFCLEAIASLPQEAEAFRRGNVRVLNKLMGYVIKSSRGRVDAHAVQERLKQLLV